MHDHRAHDDGTPPLRMRPSPGPGAPSVDLRFRALLGEAAWRRLPEAVRSRFSKRLDDGEARLFAGEVTHTELSTAGWLLARVARLAGGPLPDTDAASGPATVLVREDARLGGQIWTRTYSRPGRLPQTISSVKRFRGNTGLEEHLGFGLVMALTLSVEGGALVFRSAGYGISAFGRRFDIPDWLSPGRCTIIHRAHGDRWFTFTLDLTHPRFGRLMRQVAVFEEVGP
jgi:hypothetical protein